MKDKVKNIEYTKVAENALTSLDPKEQNKAIKLLGMVSENMTDPHLDGKLNKLTGSDINLFAVKLNIKLRIIIRILEDKVNVVDILNYDLLEKYFKKV